METQKAFITEVRAKSSLKTESEKAKVLKSNQNKLFKAFDTVNVKIGEIVESHKKEYMDAYEKHIFTLLIQVHQLREKLSMISNDTTREERLKLLTIQQNVYEGKLLQLNVDHEAITKKLQLLEDNNRIEVDKHRWLLKRIEEENKKLNKLQLIMEKLDTSDPTTTTIPITQPAVDDDMTSCSDFQDHNIDNNNNNDILNEINTVYIRKRIHALRNKTMKIQSNKLTNETISNTHSKQKISNRKLLPSLSASMPLLPSYTARSKFGDKLRNLASRSDTTKIQSHTYEIPSNTIDIVNNVRNSDNVHDNMNMMAAPSHHLITPIISNNNVTNKYMKKSKNISRQYKQEQIKIIAQQDAINGFINDCSTLCQHRTWQKYNIRNKDDLLLECSEMMTYYNEYTYFKLHQEDKEMYESFISRLPVIAKELAVLPEIYDIITSLIQDENDDISKDNEHKIL